MQIGELINMLKLLEREYGSDLDIWVRVGDKDDKEENYTYGYVVNLYHYKDGRPLLETRPPLF